MKVSLEWLKRYVSIEASPEEIAEVLPMLGIEVEAVIPVGLPRLSHVVVGEVKSRKQHPDADRLGVCEVQVGPGAGDIRQIVCGASNYKVGDRVPVALVGAVLPGNFEIKKSKLRGVDSEGMMCSARELGMGTDHGGLMILEDRPELGTPINEVFKDNDVIFDLEITANRGDCLSHIGIARELAAYYDKKVNYPEAPNYEFSQEGSFGDFFKGVELNSKNCPFYSAWCIKGVKVGASPEWLRKDLERLGLRSVNNIVDITNWVMMDAGQPLHAFDLGKIRGKKLIIRQAKAGEKVVTLDDKSRVLDEGMTVIADEERALVVAGIMGSIDGEVDGGTVDVVIESAYFNPASIRSTARRLHLSTDSGHRFVRDVDPAGVIASAQRAVGMILEMAGGEFVGEGIVLGKAPRGDREIVIDPGFVRERCGFDISDELIEGIYRRLGFSVKSGQGNWVVGVPSFRGDIYRPIDLVEEFVRMYGTSNIPESRVKLEGFSRNDDPVAVFNRVVIDYLVGQHFNECNHYTLREAKEVERLYGEEIARYSALDNPLTADHTHVRSSLLPGLWDAIKLNQHNGNCVDRLFETGRVVCVCGGKAFEVFSVALVIVAEDPHKRSWLKRSEPDFYNVKNLILEVAGMGGISVEESGFKPLNEVVSWQAGQSASVGMLSEDGFQIHVGMHNLKLLKEWGVQGTVLGAELLVNSDIFYKKKESVRFKSFSTFPASMKDLALVVDVDLPAEAVRKELGAVAKVCAAGKFEVEKVSIFDVYQGKGMPEGKKSLAFSIVFRADDRTLKDEEIMEVFEGIQQKIILGGRFSVRS